MLPTIAEIATANGNFSTLLAALTAAGLADTFASEGDYTVFAPTDEAFAALPEGTVAALLEDPEGQLKDILLYHVVNGSVPAEIVVTLNSATTLLGEDVQITVSEDGRVFLNDTVEVVVTDIMASNGIIHVIDTVLIPAN
ncbi:MAG: fasciclin domain-containing protein [Anaerolineae bacterium]|nr:fasciclin domain-containing protein [Anaerolineae bacterium]